MLRLLSGETGELQRLRAALGMPAQATTPTPDQAIPFYLIGPTGRLRALFPDAQTPAAIASDLVAVAAHTNPRVLPMIDKLRWYHRLFVALQYLLPHHLLSALMLRATRVRWRAVKDLLIGAFVRHYRVDLSEARESDPRAYASFNAFFTRPLRQDARPIATQEDSLVCPADGTLSQLGAIGGGRVFQAKGHDCSLPELLGGREDWAQRFDGGEFATIYLSPRDYHRVHMPVAAGLREMIHVPGRLFSVNSVTTAAVPRLFGRNERVVCLFEAASGPMALILVGAIFVGSMETVWAGQVTPTRLSKPARTDAGKTAIRLDRGAEMGRFNMGSTVILLFGPGRVAWEPGLAPGAPLRMGQRIGRFCEQTPG